MILGVLSDNKKYLKFELIVQTEMQVHLNKLECCGKVHLFQ